MIHPPAPISAYTDGSCHTQLRVGAWASILFIGEKKVLLEGVEADTTHNRMELMAAIESVSYLDSLGIGQQELLIYSDSQYVVNLSQRMDKLRQKGFKTKSGTPVQNDDLVQRFIQLIESHRLLFIKVKAHQKNGNAWNREVDLLVRNRLRKEIKNQAVNHEL